MSEPDPPPPFRFLSDEGDRGAHMAARVRRTARRAGVAGPGLDLVERAHTLAMGPRRARLSNDHHPDFLHPGRTALILLLDAGVGEPGILAAAVLAETARPELRVETSRIEQVLGSTAVDREVGDLRDAVPVPGAPRWAEELVAAPREVRLVALAEFLDRVRHLGPGGRNAPLDPEAVAETRRWAVELYAPVAERTDPGLARRFRWWARRTPEPRS